MTPLSPRQVLESIANTVDEETRSKIIIVGSLAAAYHFQGDDGGEKLVRTKDGDAMVSPHAAAIGAAQDLTNKLLENGWTLRKDPLWGQSGGPNVPTEDLPLVRLNPPGVADWFIELLAAPDETQAPKMERQFHRIETKLGHFGLVSFGFLGLAQHAPINSKYGVHVATPAMMALANMLHHPRVGAEVIRGMRVDAPVRRSNKDLGRVIALATLGGEEEYSTWAEKWWDGLNEMYPQQAVELALRAGSGLREMLASHDFMEQAYYTCTIGLLAGEDVDQRAFAVNGRIVLQEAIEPLEKMAKQDQERHGTDRPKEN